MNTNLIDMFGLSGDQESDNRLDELFARLEADIENSCSLGSHTANPGNRLHSPQARPIAGCQDRGATTPGLPGADERVRRYSTLKHRILRGKWPIRIPKYRG